MVNHERCIYDNNSLAGKIHNSSTKSKLMKRQNPYYYYIPLMMCTGGSVPGLTPLKSGRRSNAVVMAMESEILFLLFIHYVVALQEANPL